MKCALASMGFINEDVHHNKNVIIETMKRYAKDADIIFRESRWQGDTLRSLAFVFGGKQFTVAASAEEEYMTVKVEPCPTETA